MGFGGVFDDHQVMPPGNITERLHIHRMPINVDRHYGPGARSDFSLDLPDIHAPGARITIH